MTVEWLFLIAFSILAFSTLMSWLVRSAAHRFGFVAHPRPDRWHAKPTALLGGVGVYAAFMVGFLAYMPKTSSTMALAACATVLFLLGLIDDVRGVGPQTKLAVQILVSLALILSGATLRFSDSEILTLLITLLWLVGITNAMNLLDNMDGLCAGVAIIACAFRVAFCLIENDQAGLISALVLLSAIAGFLVFNYHPASIFLGDSGSLFIGFTLAGMTAGAHPYSKNIGSVLLFPVLVLAIPIFDTTLVTIMRRVSGKSIAVGGRDHSSHRLVAAGISERRAVLILWAIAFLAGLIAYLQYLYGFSLTLLLISLFLIGLLLFGIYLSRIQVYESGDEAGPVQTESFRFIVSIPSQRYLFLIVFDILLVLTAYYGAYALRFEGIVPGGYNFERFAESTPFAVLTAIFSFLVFGLYHQSWRYTSLKDLIPMIKACACSTVLLLLALAFVYRLTGFSRTVFVIYLILLILLLAATRLSFRLLSELLTGESPQKKRVLIYGAGAGGESVLRELEQNQALDSEVVGFLDDDAVKLKMKIRGIPVLGDHRSTDFWVRKLAIEQVIISSAKIPDAKVHSICQACEASGAQVARASIRFERLAG